MTGCVNTATAISKQHFVKVRKAEPISIIIPEWYSTEDGDYCLSPKEYEKSSKLMIDFWRYAKQQNEIIDSYNKNGELSNEQEK